MLFSAHALCLFLLLFSILWTYYVLGLCIAGCFLDIFSFISFPLLSLTFFPFPYFFFYFLMLTEEQKRWSYYLFQNHSVTFLISYPSLCTWFSCFWSLPTPSSPCTCISLVTTRDCCFYPYHFLEKEAACLKIIFHMTFTIIPSFSIHSHNWCFPDVWNEPTFALISCLTYASHFQWDL